jgi:hypothetical protein
MVIGKSGSSVRRIISLEWCQYIEESCRHYRFFLPPCIIVVESFQGTTCSQHQRQITVPRHAFLQHQMSYIQRI